jgi:CheY-like chemotaxis protein
MDDEDFIRDVTTEMLKTMGYKVTTAADGDEAILLVREAARKNHQFIIAILDLTIPGWRGGK